MSWTAEVNQRSQIGEYLIEDLMRSQLESGSSKWEFGLWCVSYVGETLLGPRTRARTQGELNY